MRPREINWSIDDISETRVERIINRATELAQSKNYDFDDVSTQMDLIAVHNHVMHLDFKQLLEADEQSFIHDIWGIASLFDREQFSFTDKLWSPRCAKGK